MELKHAEMQKRRLDDGLQANKLEREELVILLILLSNLHFFHLFVDSSFKQKQIFLDEKANLESALAGFSARSDAAEKRLQLELDSITKKYIKLLI
jgi:hypothetical protein